MKICVISTGIFRLPVSGYSGLEHLAWLQAKGLAAKGHEVSLVAPEGSECPGVGIIPCVRDERRSYKSYWECLPSFDAIIDSSWNKWAYILKGEGKLKTPVLGVCHAPINTMMGSLPPNVEKPCFVCISEDQAKHFEALHNHEAKVAYNGVDTEEYRPIGIPRSHRFLFLARFSTVKCPDLCQDVCIEVGEGLDLIGDTTITGEPEFLEACKRKADGKRIKIHGGASRGETVWWYSQARALLHLTSRFREPFGLAPVESMLCGTPVLGWNYGALKETIKDGVSGRLVSSVKEAVEVIRSGSLDRIDREGCREWAKQFSVERMVDRYEELAIEAIDTGGW